MKNNKTPSKIKFGIYMLAIASSFICDGAFAQRYKRSPNSPYPRIKPYSRYKPTPYTPTPHYKPTPYTRPAVSDNGKLPSTIVLHPQCGSIAVAEGHNVTILKYAMGNQAGMVHLQIEAVSIPGKIAVRCGAQTVFVTDYFYGKQDISFKYSPKEAAEDSKTCSVVVTTAEKEAYVWRVQMGCPTF